MKKPFIFLLFMASANLVWSQITRIHAFPGSINYCYDKGFYSDYFFTDRKLDTVDIYNSDFSFRKQIIIPQIPGMSLDNYTFHPGFNYYDTDDDLEYLVKYFKSPSTYDTTLIIIYEEDGSILKQFGVYNQRVRAYSYDLNGREILELCFYNVKANKFDSTVFYTLPYTYQKSSHLKSNSTVLNKPYPNPSNETVTIEYSLQPYDHTTLSVYSQDGKPVEQLMIGGAFNRVQLDVTRYKPGIYYYQYNNQRGRFVVY